MTATMEVSFTLEDAAAELAALISARLHSQRVRVVSPFKGGGEPVSIKSVSLLVHDEDRALPLSVFSQRVLLPAAVPLANVMLMDGAGGPSSLAFCRELPVDAMPHRIAEVERNGIVVYVCAPNIAHIPHSPGVSGMQFSVAYAEPSKCPDCGLETASSELMFSHCCQ